VGQQRRSLKESGAATDQVDGASASVEVLSGSNENNPLLGVTVSIEKNKYVRIIIISITQLVD